MKKRSLFLGLIASIIAGCATVSSTINRTQQIISGRIYTAEKNSDFERYSEEKAKESACNNARNTLAKSIESDVRADQVYEQNYKNGRLEERIKDFMQVKTNATISGARIEKTQCNKTKRGIFTKTTEYDCSCEISISQLEYYRLIEEHRRNRTIEKTTALVKDNNNRSFRIEKQEVTIGDFAAYLKMEGIKSYEPKCRNKDKWIKYVLNPEDTIWSKNPMLCIDQETAKNYCNFFGKDLPTEEQWEYAAGISYGWLYPWGDDEPTTEPPKKNFGQIDSYEISTKAVDQIPQDISSFGVLGMGGNVAEWTKSQESGRHIAKGGAWNLPTDQTRIKSRILATKPSTSIGFRCVYNR